MRYTVKCFDAIVKRISAEMFNVARFQAKCAQERSALRQLRAP